MRVLVTGSQGLIGSAVVAALQESGRQVRRLVRSSPRPGEVRWDPDSGEIDLGGLQGIDAAIHLAGENLAAGRWTAERKSRLVSSRVDSTRLLCDCMARLVPRPHVLLSASAVGFYGDRGEEVLAEDAPPGHGFLADLCRQWEAACQPAIDAGIRVVNLRFGVVLSANGGALPKMLAPFRIGLGGVLGSGRQYVSWITLDDAVQAMLHLLQSESVSGPVNLCAPNPVTNRELTKALGRALHRPTIARVPAFMLRTLFGEMADQTLLSSQRAVPTRLQDGGFSFAHPNIESALNYALT